MHDPVNHPAHYTYGKREVIDLTRQLDFDLGNAAKYILRARHKNGVEDVQKALWYVHDAVKHGSVVPPSLRELAAEYDSPELNVLVEAFCGGTPSPEAFQRVVDALQLMALDIKFNGKAA